MLHSWLESIPGTSPLVISVPHAGTIIPEECRFTFATLDQQHTLRDTDWHIHDLYRPLAVKHKAAFVATHISRVVIDCNRDPAEWQASFVKSGTVLKKYSNLALVPAKNTHDVQLLKSPLDDVELVKRISTYHLPFHVALNHHVQTAIAKHGYCIHLDAHSMPSSGTKAHTDPNGARADFVPADHFGKTCTPNLMAHVVQCLKQTGHSIAPNSPYSGKYIILTQGRPHEHSHAFMLEINRKLYMNEQTYERLDKPFSVLSKQLNQLILGLSQFNPESTHV